MSETVAKQPEQQFPRQGAGLYLNLSVFWFALSFLWAGMITIVMQRMVKDMVGDAKKDLYLGWTLALGALISTVIVIIVGALSDRSRWKMGRRRPYIILGSVLSLPCLLWLSQVHTIWMLTLVFCFIQLWVNVATSPYQALVPDMVPKERQGTASAYLGMTSLAGQLGGLLLCGLLLSGKLVPVGSGLAITMMVIALVMAASMLYTVWRVKERSAADNPMPQLGLIEAVRESFRVNPRQYPDFMRLIASRFVINMGFYTATEFLAYYVSDTLRVPAGVVDTTVAKILLVVTVAGLIGNYPAGTMADRMSKKRVVYASTSITCVAALVFLLTSQLPVALVASAFFGVGFGAFMAVDWAFATNLLPDHDEAKYMGIWHVAFTVPQVLAPFIGGTIAHLFNVYMPQRYAWLHDLGPGLGYRVTLLLVIVYLVIGTAMIRPIRERVIPQQAA